MKFSGALIVIYRQFAVFVRCTHILTTSITGLMKICSTEVRGEGGTIVSKAHAIVMFATTVSTVGATYASSNVQSVGHEIFLGIWDIQAALSNPLQLG